LLAVHINESDVALYYYYYCKCQDLDDANHKKLRGTLHKLTNYNKNKNS